jgi:hypothetical protein
MRCFHRHAVKQGGRKHPSLHSVHCRGNQKRIARIDLNIPDDGIDGGIRDEMRGSLDVRGLGCWRILGIDGGSRLTQPPPCVCALGNAWPGLRADVQRADWRSPGA